MRVALISFTKKGANTCRKIEEGLISEKHVCRAYGMKAFAKEAGVLPIKTSLSQWTEEAFAKDEVIVFVGASGIAVRAIAPYIRDKTVDPAVVVVDEKGQYAISLLSGHLGGANLFTNKIAGILGAEPVITTATDLNHKFAVDEWAKRNKLFIENMQMAKEISAAILNGEMIGVSTDFPIVGSLPDGLYYKEGHEENKEFLEKQGNKEKIGLKLSIKVDSKPFHRMLHLVPKTVTMGIGCRSGIPLETIEALLDKVLMEQKISVHAIEKLCSIDIKKGEASLNQLAVKIGIPFQVFSKEELA